MTLAGVSATVSGLTADIALINTDITTINTEITNLQTDVGLLQDKTALITSLGPNSISIGSLTSVVYINDVVYYAYNPFVNVNQWT